MSVKRGDIYYADLSPVVGSEQGGLRPVLIIQNDVGNRYSPTVIAAAITSRLGKARMPTHIDVHADRVGLVKDSVILLEQVRTLDKRRLKEKMGHLDEHMMEQVNRAIAVSVGLGDWRPEERHEAKPRVHAAEAAPSPAFVPEGVPAAAAVVDAPEVGVGDAVATGMPDATAAQS
ncbi:MAG: type II toxin-antitoxin system PemK/MazF family toxin [Clostridia bacterium]|nr:type II toxin-antitoxin system PemK/MazF family toxin [Clostridia bacterium]